MVFDCKSSCECGTGRSGQRVLGKSGRVPECSFPIRSHMHHQRVPREASKTASLATNGVLNKLVSIQIHHLSSHFLYAHAFGGTLVLHIGCTHHIFMIFFFMSKFLCLSSYVVLSSFRTIFVLSFCLSFFSFYLLFFLVFIIMLRLLQITYIHTTYNKLCSMCCTVLCV